MHPLITEHLKERPPQVLRQSYGRASIIHHYTGFQGLYGIIKTQEMWATSIRHMDDAREFKESLDSLNLSIHKAQKEECNNNLLGHITDLVEGVMERNVFVASFSEESDSLSQWRAYCPNGGVSIGFWYDDLERFARKQNFLLMKCVYDDDEKEKFVDALIKESFRKANAGVSPEQCAGEFVEQFILMAACFKHISFAEECEWRLVSEPITRNHPQCEFRATETMLKPIFRFSLGERQRIEREVFNFGFDHFYVGRTITRSLSLKRWRQ